MVSYAYVCVVENTTDEETVLVPGKKDERFSKHKFEDEDEGEVVRKDYERLQMFELDKRSSLHEISEWVRRNKDKIEEIPESELPERVTDFLNREW